MRINLSETTYDRLLRLAAQAVDRIAESQCNPDEYGQLGPLIAEEFERRRQAQRQERRTTPRMPRYGE